MTTNGGHQGTLRSWLRQQQQPSKIRVWTADGDEKIIEVSERSNRWAVAEEAICDLGAVKIEALNARGSVLRTRVLEEEPETSASASKGSGVGREWAAFAREVMNGCNESFKQGADAAAVSQTHLVEIVQVLASSLSSAIQQFHAMSMNVSHLMQELAGAEGGGDANGQMIGQLLGAAVMKGMGGGNTAPPNERNGGKK